MQIHGPPRKIYCIHQDLCLHLIGTQLNKKKKKVTMLKQNLKKKKSKYIGLIREILCAAMNSGLASFSERISPCDGKDCPENLQGSSSQKSLSQ